MGRVYSGDDIIILKELGKMSPYVRKKETHFFYGNIKSGRSTVYQKHNF